MRTPNVAMKCFLLEFEMDFVFWIFEKLYNWLSSQIQIYNEIHFHDEFEYNTYTYSYNSAVKIYSIRFSSICDILTIAIEMFVFICFLSFIFYEIACYFYDST